MTSKKDMKINFEVGPKVVRIADVILIPREIFSDMIKFYKKVQQEEKNNE